MSETPSNLPARLPLDRAALERVLARAAELQVGTSDTPELLSEEQLLEIGREVGLPAQHLRQALAEERTRVVLADEEGLAAQLAGPAHATASRVVVGEVGAVLGRLDEWMRREECLQVKRRFGDRITWEARRDFVSQLRRDLNLGGRGYALARAAEVAATATAVDAGRVLVRLDADVSNVRRQRLAAGGVSAVGGVATAGTLVTMGIVANSILVALVPLAALPMAAGIGAAYALARSHRKAVARTQLALEQLLDRLEHGEMRRPGSLLEALTSAARNIK